MSDSGTFKVNPIHDAQQRALAAEAICQDILTGARNQLYLNMRFLDSALAALPFVGEMGIHPVGTDGNVLYYQPEELMELFKKGTEGEPCLSAQPAALYFSPCVSRAGQ